jgi:hypothetical protein
MRAYRSTCASVSVEPRLRTAVNVNRTEPMRIESPSASRMVDSRRRSLTNVPLTDSNIRLTDQDIRDIIAFLRLL